MHKKKCKLLVAILCANTFISNSIAQKGSSWHMQVVPIQTKWSKDVNPEKTWPEYPRPQMVRNSNWKNLNGLWSYAITAKDSPEPSTFQGNILVPYPLESALSGVKKSLQPTENLWYKRSFRLDVKMGEKTLLHFGAVDWQATVYVNGEEVGTHTGGYTGFSFDITNAIKPGANDLVVKVYDPTDQGIGPHGKQVLRPNSIYYTPSSGIWQTVWLETVPSVYVDNILLTPRIDANQIIVGVNAAGSVAGVKVDIVASAQGKRVGSISGMIGDVFAIKVPNAHLWSPEDPFLYDLEVTLTKNNKVMDRVTSYFGMRKVEIKKDGKGVDRIFLNNKYYYNLGVLDQGFWPDGLYTAPSDDALAFDIKAIKAMGFNTIRKHIKVEPSRWYYHADKLGILVWQDFVNPNQRLPEGAKHAFEQQLKETMDQLRNFPCITTWVIFNEKWGQYDQVRITEWVKEEDPSRLVNAHSGELLYVNNQLRSPSSNPYVSADMTDVHSYPFPRNSLAQPGKARVLGEFGGIGVPIEDHLWDDLVTGWGYDGIVSPNIMKRQYKQMIDSLTKLQIEGLSASIYTQPFDVESEQNGLLTYDRCIIKLPVDTFRAINSKLWPPTINSSSNEFIAAVADTISLDYPTRLTRYKEGRKDIKFIRTLAIMAHKQKDSANARFISNEYIREMEHPLEIPELKFLLRYTRSRKDLGFQILYNNRQKIDTILGKDKVDQVILACIEIDEIKPFIMKNVLPDWPSIEKNAITNYGRLGEEAVLQTKVFHSYNNGNWDIFFETIQPWYEKYGSKRDFVTGNALNNIAWAIFERSNDSQTLQLALSMCEKVLVDREDANALDTYANLLYKLGRRNDAIRWQEKALKLDPESKWKNEAYSKMKSGEPTWK